MIWGDLQGFSEDSFGFFRLTDIEQIVRLVDGGSRSEGGRFNLRSLRSGLFFLVAAARDENRLE